MTSSNGSKLLSILRCIFIVLLLSNTPLIWRCCMRIYLTISTTYSRLCVCTWLRFVPNRPQVWNLQRLRGQLPAPICKSVFQTPRVFHVGGPSVFAVFHRSSLRAVDESQSRVDRSLPGAARITLHVKYNQTCEAFAHQQVIHTHRHYIPVFIIACEQTFDCADPFVLFLLQRTFAYLHSISSYVGRLCFVCRGLLSPTLSFHHIGVHAHEFQTHVSIAQCHDRKTNPIRCVRHCARPSCAVSLSAHIIRQHSARQSRSVIAGSFVVLCVICVASLAFTSHGFTDSFLFYRGFPVCIAVVWFADSVCARYLHWRMRSSSAIQSGRTGNRAQADRPV